MLTAEQQAELKSLVVAVEAHAVTSGASPWLRDWIHNSIVHPMMPLFAVQESDQLHDQNATWAFGLERFDEVALERGVDPG